MSYWIAVGIALVWFGCGRLGYVLLKRKFIEDFGEVLKHDAWNKADVWGFGIAHAMCGPLALVVTLICRIF